MTKKCNQDGIYKPLYNSLYRPLFECAYNGFPGDGGGGESPNSFFINVDWYANQDGINGGLNPQDIPPPDVAPVINSASLSGSTITISGESFGSKAQAAPALIYDDGVGYLNGSATDDLTVSAHNDPYVASPTIWRTVEDIVVNKNILRYPTQQATFSTVINQGLIREFLPLNTLPTPTGSQLYFRYFMRSKTNLLGRYYKMRVAPPVGTFSVDEASIVETVTFGDVAATVANLVNIVDQGAYWDLYISSDSTISEGDLTSVSVTGNSSLATTTTLDAANIEWERAGSDKICRWFAKDGSGATDGVNGFQAFSLDELSCNSNEAGVSVYQEGAPIGAGSSNFSDFSYTLPFEDTWHEIELIVDGTSRGDTAAFYGVASASVSVDAVAGVFTVDQDLTATLTPGMEVQFNQLADGNDQRFTVLSVTPVAVVVDDPLSLLITAPAATTDILYDFIPAGTCAVYTDGVLPENNQKNRITNLMPVQYFFGKIPDITSHGMDTNTGALGDRISFGDQVIDTSLARIYVSDKPTWEEAKTSKEYLTATSWADGALTCEFKQRALPTGDFYIYVFNESNQVNQNGALLSV